MVISRTSLESGPPPLLDIIVRPSAGGNGGMSSGPGKYIQRNIPLRQLLSNVYQVPAVFVVGDAVEEATRYDVAVTGPRTEDKALRKLLPDLLAIALHVSATRETRQTDGWILTAPHGKPESLKEAASSGGSSRWGDGTLSMIQSELGKPVVDKTGISGRFDFSLKYDGKRPESILEALREFGFEFEAATLPTEYLVVTKK
jgi:hypothetical protein